MYRYFFSEMLTFARNMNSTDIDKSQSHARLFNKMKPRQNGRQFPEDIFKCISNKIYIKFVSKGPINSIPALVHIMAWCRPSDKPLSETMMVSLLTHICITRPKWFNEQCCQISPLRTERSYPAPPFEDVMSTPENKINLIFQPFHS